MVSFTLDPLFNQSPALTQAQLYALAFLIGSFAVAALSDIKHLSAPVEFPEVWFLAIIFLVALDIYGIKDNGLSITLPAKWLLIALLSTLSYRPIGILFKLEIGDVLAIAAVMALLNPLFLLFFFLLLKLLTILLAPVLVRLFGKREAYPFMPIVLLASMGVFFLGMRVSGILG